MVASAHNGGARVGVTAHFRAAAAVALAALLCLAGSGPARAQVLVGALFGEKLASPTVNLGFEVGMNFATLDGLDGAARTNHPVFGLVADWRFSEHVHLTAGFLPIAGRGASGFSPVSTGDPAIDDQTAGTPATRRFGYLEFPVLLHWAPKREAGFRLGLGPSLGVITGAHDRYDVATDAGGYVVERDIGDLVPGFDLGVSFDVEWRLPMLSIAARYTEGLTDLRLPGETMKARSRLLTGTGRIWLGKKKKASP